MTSIMLFMHDDYAFWLWMMMLMYFGVVVLFVLQTTAFTNGLDRVIVLLGYFCKLNCYL